MKNDEEKRRTKATTLALIASLLIMSAFMSAGSLASGIAPSSQQMSTLEKGERIAGPGFFAGNIIRIDGTVDGVTIAFGQEVRVNGDINGDLFVAAQNIYINGTVSGNIYVVGQVLELGAKCKGDAFMGGQNVTIDNDALIGRDMFVGGAVIRHEGAVGRKLFGGGEEIMISGSVGGDANLQVNKLNLQDTAKIEGNLVYEGANKAYIDTGAKVKGETKWTYLAPKTMEKAVEKARTPVSIIGGVMWSVASALLIWFVVKVWRPDFWAKTARPIADQPLKAMGLGLLALVVTPLIVILSMITVVGIPLGVIMGLVYGVAIYMSRIVAAVFIGSWLAGRFGWAELHKGVWLVLAGLVVLSVLCIPKFLGFIVWLIFVTAGLGALILSHYRKVEE
jgi:cytoskeletal protein CcmA (bactofilin family)